MPRLQVTAEQLADMIAKGLVKFSADEGNGKPRKVPLAQNSFAAPGTWVVGVLVRPGNNSRGQRAKIARGGHEKRPVYRALARNHREIAPFAEAAQAGKRVRCTLTRLSPCECDDDNLGDALKYCRDAVADFLGCGDGPKDPVTWVPRQEKAEVMGVRIELELM